MDEGKKSKNPCFVTAGKREGTVYKKEIKCIENMQLLDTTRWREEWRGEDHKKEKGEKGWGRGAMVLSL